MGDFNTDDYSLTINGQAISSEISELSAISILPETNESGNEAELLKPFTFAIEMPFNPMIMRMSYDDYITSLPESCIYAKQLRRHRKARVNKKWKKRYGYKLKSFEEIKGCLANGVPEVK